MSRFKILTLATLVATLAGTAYWYRSSNDNAAKAGSAKPSGPVPVTVAQAKAGEMPVLLDVVGRAEAYEGVTMKSRVDGQVATVAYTEGQHVKTGDVLVRLDPGDFNAKALQAEANLAKDEAQLAKAKADTERYVSLKAKGFVSDEKVNEIRTAEAAAAATVKADQAALELARLQLSYTTIRAPFAGVVGARLVFPGSAVKVNDTALVVVNRIRPLYVTFSVPEKHLPRLRAAMANGPMKVQITIPGNKDKPLEGNARFIDNAVDATTGTIQMKAVVENTDEHLTPGQFLNVSMVLDKLTDTVLVPNEAVQQGAEGHMLYAVKADQTVEPRKIKVLASYRGFSAIGAGVAPGETVVTDGQLRLSPGAHIKLKGGAKAEGPAPGTPTAGPGATAAAAPAAPQAPSTPAIATTPAPANPAPSIGAAAPTAPASAPAAR